MNSTDDEQEWRTLLERAVPDLRAPDDRIQQVRWRIRRRRRQRAAACLGALAVASVATVTSLIRTPATPDPPATPHPTASHDSRTAHYPELSGLTVRLPEGWSARSAEDPATGEALGFASTQPMTGELTCSKDRPKDSPCAPPTTLGRGDALIVFRTGATADATATDGPRLRTAKALSSLCRTLGATQQRDVGLRLSLGGGREPVTVHASVCLRDAPGEVRTAAEEITSSAHLGNDSRAADPSTPR
ncbi:hypothetical protein KN815_07195 [Streptomyces sp. 4503]|uniref:Uncharacterized protein n=1 Tax=Streptomyces niphimycinicus TaxID=2842201 RepID=A0ABS6CAE7_9ACTN|nr:hypothetical protein [Streptomyces niphimycinicus]MBU3863876.1 hypothetical protein [Streptomyces niphimycinicus]